MMEHSKECLDRTAKALTLIADWESRWPNYCTKCDGRGEFVYSFDPSPAGVSLSSGTMEDAEPCAQCTERGICARCGEQAVASLEAESPCLFCGWDFDDGLPEMPECFCWVRDVDDAVEELANMRIVMSVEHKGGRYDS